MAIDPKTDKTIPPAAKSIELIRDLISRTTIDAIAPHYYDNYVKPILGNNPTDEQAHYLNVLLSDLTSTFHGTGNREGYDDGWKEGTAKP